jgi:hypothetical protein
MPRMNVLNTVEREARRLPGGTSTCSASMISRQKSCGIRLPKLMN